jgi:hypothetical protein
MTQPMLWKTRGVRLICGVAGFALAAALVSLVAAWSPWRSVFNRDLSGPPSYRAGSPEEIEALIAVIKKGDIADSLVASERLVMIGDKARVPIREALAESQARSSSQMLANAYRAAVSDDYSEDIPQLDFQPSFHTEIVLRSTLERIEQRSGARDGAR